MIVVPNLVQGTQAWLETRLGVLTASQINKLITPSLKLSSQRTELIAKLAAETVLGEPVEDFAGTYWTDRGTELEDEAAAYFSLQTGLEPHHVGFVYRDESNQAGCSPDWLIKDSGGDWIAGGEMKCPKATTHVQYVLGDGYKKYNPQVQFSLWVTQLPVWWFMSYHPGLKPVLVQVKPDPYYQAAFDKLVPPFLQKVSEAVERIR